MMSDQTPVFDIAPSSFQKNPERPSSLTVPRVLILGAGGFIGRQICLTLADHGSAVPIAVVRRPLQDLADRDIEQRLLDATDVTALRDACRDVQVVVFSLAGAPAVMKAALSALRDVVGSHDQAMRVVYLSSLSVYGDQTGQLDENAPLLGSSPYALDKIAGEQVVQQFDDWLILRPGIVFGPGSPTWAHFLGELLLTGRMGLPVAGLQAPCNLVAVQDLAACVLACVQQPERKATILNVRAPWPTSAFDGQVFTWADFFAAYASALGLPAPRPRGFWWNLWHQRLEGPGRMVLHKLLAPQSPPPAVIRPWLVKQCAQGPEMKIDRLNDLFAIPWTPVAQILQDCVRALRHHNLRPK